MLWGVAEWFAGVTAVAAIVTAVAVVATAWWTYTTRKIKLHGYCGIRRIYAGPHMFTRHFALETVNDDVRPVTIEHVGLKIGAFENKHMLVLWLSSSYKSFFRPGPASSIPIKLDDGEKAEWFFSLRYAIKYFVDSARTPRPLVQTKSDAKKLRFVVYTTRGQQKSIKPEKSLVCAIIRALNTQSS